MSNKRYTKEQYEQAKQINLVDFLSSQGFSFTQQGRYFKCKEHDSLVIQTNGKWYWNSKDLAGYNVIDFLVKINGLSPYDAIMSLCNCSAAVKVTTAVEKENVPFVAPERAKTYRRAFAYLNQTRGIDGDIISRLMGDHKIYETADFHNCAFVGFGKNKEPKYISLRGTYTKQGNSPFKADVPSSDKTYGFHMVGKSKNVYVFESPIDAMSHATLEKIKGEDYELDHRLSLGCTWDGALERFLKNNEINTIIFCLDNDNGGKTACEHLMQKYHELGYAVEKSVPKEKDFNSELLLIIKE